MRKLIEMPVEDGSVLVAVEIPEGTEEEIRKVGVLDIFKSIPVDQNFDAITDLIVKYSKPIIKSFEALTSGDIAASKASAEFGLSFTGKGNIYLVETTLQAAIKVNIEWDLGKQQKEANCQS